LQTPADTSERVLFGNFEFDCRTGDLRRDGASLKLEPQPAKVLGVLIRSAGRVVTRAELAQQVWGEETFVDFEQGLNYAIRRIRIALDDVAERPQFLETLPKKGYRFIAPVSHAPQNKAPALSAVAPASTAVPPSKPAQSRRTLLWISAATLLLAAGIFTTVRLSRRNGEAAVGRPVQSIAVLPLRNLSNDPEQEYFSEGMTDELITDLAKVNGLRVISHTSVERYKQGTTPLPQIARELGVDAIVEGTVTRAGNRVRISAQLIDSRTDMHLWAESYERELPDVLALQDVLANDIADGIRPKVASKQSASLSESRKTNPEAFDAYLRGRYLWNKRNSQAIGKATEYFQEAIQKDPNFALAYSGLSDCYWIGWGAKIDHPLAEQYARKAISLAPDLAEGHASLGMILIHNRDLDAGQKELRRAIELNPNYAMAHHFYSTYLLSVGLTDDALAESDLALQLDPFGVAVNSMRTFILIDSNKLDQALTQANRVAEIAPQTAPAYELLSRVYWLQGRVPEAIDADRKSGTINLFMQWVRDQDEVEAVYTRSGVQAARLRAAQFNEKDKGAFSAAYLYGLAKDNDQAFENLDAAYSRKDEISLEIKTAPEFASVRNDPRYPALLRKLGLAP
jgi:TolB-like protein/DNA-binding winged helix-turn-helix (wHTH) protein/Tfp pilus assembly protein PilF